MGPLELLNETKKNFDWFKKEYKQLQKKYPGKYVAIKNKEIIESDEDYYLLLKKLEKLGENSSEILIKRVNNPNEVLVYNG